MKRQMKTNTPIIDGKIELFSFIDNERCERVISLAVLPKSMAADWNGHEINLIDWKIDASGTTVVVEYQTRNDPYAPILDAKLACEQVRIKLTPPTRSRNWQWRPMWSYWKNVKTGEEYRP